MTHNESMPLIENSFAAIVITAQTFNPSIFTETWLTQNGVVPVEAFVGLRVFSPEVVQFQTSDLQILVVPPKMQITFGTHGVSGDMEFPRRIATRIIELLPHTPYQALGLNFDFFVAQPSGQEFSTYNRVLLGSGDYRIIQEFSSSDSQFGRYFSKNHGEARLTLDIRPVQAGPEKKDLLKFSFNFHHEVSKIESPQRAGKLTQMIGNWAALRQYAQRLIELGSTL